MIWDFVIWGLYFLSMFFTLYKMDQWSDAASLDGVIGKQPGLISLIGAILGPLFVLCYMSYKFIEIIKETEDKRNRNKGF